MNLPLHIATKYFFSVKKRAFINFISILAVIIVAAVTAASILVISTMNGFTEYIHQYEGALEGDIKITTIKGKTFELSESQMNSIRGLDGVSYVTEVIEDHAFIVKQRNRKQWQKVVKVKGVSPAYYEQFQFEDFGGLQRLYMNGKPSCFMGYNVAKHLHLDHDDVSLIPQHLQLLYPQPSNQGKQINSLNSVIINAVGEFQQYKYDLDYVIVPLETARELFGYENQRTSIEIMCETEKSAEVQEQIRTLVDEGFEIKNKEEQNEVLMKAIKLEKVIIFIILLIVMGIASINIFFSLSMLEIEKRKDLAILHSFGMNKATIRKTFILIGSFIALMGGTLGFALGIGICHLQMEYGLFSPGEVPYPMKLNLVDNLIIAASVIGITVLISIRPSNRAASIQFDQSL